MIWTRSRLRRRRRHKSAVLCWDGSKISRSWYCTKMGTNQGTNEHLPLLSSDLPLLTSHPLALSCRSKQYLTLTCRGLYQHVISSITDLSSIQRDSSTEGYMNSSIIMGQTKYSNNARDCRSHLSSSIIHEEFVGRQTGHKDRLGGYLHPRDMRRLVTPFSSSNEPGIIVRRHVMLFNFDPLRAIILRDRLLVL
jgi:hypothetical protein